MTESSVPAPFVPFPAGSPLAGPKNIGQILTHTFRLTRAHFGLLVGIAVPPTALIFFIVVAMEAVLLAPMIAQFPNPTPQSMFRFFEPAIFLPAIVIFVALNTAILSIYAAAASYASTQADLGVKVTFRQAYEAASSRAGRHLWLLTWIYLRAFLPLLVAEAAFFGAAATLVLEEARPNPAVILLLPLGMMLIFAACVYGIVVALRLSLAFPACVEEGLTARAAIERSNRLTQGAKGRIFLVFLVLYAALYAAMMVLELVAVVLGVIGYFVFTALQIHPAAPWSYIGLGLLVVCALILMVLATALTYATAVAALAVLYHDQRLRKDVPLPAPPLAGEPA